MSGLILISVALTAVVGALCSLLYKQQLESLRSQRTLVKEVNEQRELLLSVGVVVTEIEQISERLSKSQQRLTVKVEHLATDILQRDIYQSADDRHQLAIQSARQGMDLFELVQRHGLSSDEAALIMSLHSPDGYKNKQTSRDLVMQDRTQAEVI